MRSFSAKFSHHIPPLSMNRRDTDSLKHELPGVNDVNMKTRCSREKSVLSIIYIQMHGPLRDAGEVSWTSFLYRDSGSTVTAARLSG